MKSKRIFLIVGIGFCIGLTLSSVKGDLLGGFLEKVTGKAKEEVGKETGKATGFLKKIVGKVAEVGVELKEKAQKAYDTVKGLGIALVKILLRANFRTWILVLLNRMARRRFR